MARSVWSRSGSAGSSCPRPRASTSRTSRPSSRPGWTTARPESAGGGPGPDPGAPKYPAAMRIDEIIAAQGPTFSVEFFPPKTAEATEQLYATARELGHLELDFASV